MSTPSPESFPLPHSPTKVARLWRQANGFSIVLAKLASGILPTDIRVNDTLLDHTYGAWDVISHPLERDPEQGQPLGRHGVMVTEQGRLALYGTTSNDSPEVTQIFDYTPELTYPWPDSALLFNKHYQPTPDSVICQTEILIPERDEIKVGIDALVFGLEVLRARIDAATS